MTLPLFGESPKTRSGVAQRSEGQCGSFSHLALVGIAAYAANAALKICRSVAISLTSRHRRKFEGQDKGDYGVLVGGRPETLVAIQAIMDSPILGHGSFAEGDKYVWLKQKIQYEHGYSDTDIPEEGEYNTIPTHSHLTLAWVEGGLLGRPLLAVYILVLTLKALLRADISAASFGSTICLLFD